MRKQRVVLEHHRRAAFRRRQVGNVRTAENDIAAGDALVPGDHAKGRGLAAAGRAKEAGIGAGGEPVVDGVDRDRVAVAFGGGRKLKVQGCRHDRACPSSKPKSGFKRASPVPTLKNCEKLPFCIGSSC
jgi:hypothetical protein